MKVRELVECVSCELVRVKNKNECTFCGGEITPFHKPFVGSTVNEIKERWELRNDVGIMVEHYDKYDSFEDFIREIDPEIHKREIQEIKEYARAWSDEEERAYGVRCEVADAIANSENDMATVILFQGTYWFITN